MSVSLETIISVLGLAIALGGLVHILREKEHRRDIIVATIFVAIAGFMSVLLFQNFQYEREIRFIRGETLSQLGAKNRSYEDLQHHLGNIEGAMLAETLERIRRSGEAFSRVVVLHDGMGSPFAIRLYGVQRVGPLQ